MKQPTTSHRRWLTHVTGGLFDQAMWRVTQKKRSIMLRSTAPGERGNFFRFFLGPLYGWPLLGERGEEEERTKRGCGVPRLGCRGGNQPGKPSGCKELRHFPPHPAVHMDRGHHMQPAPEVESRWWGWGLASECGHADLQGVSLSSCFPAGERWAEEKEAQERQNQ